MNFERTLIEKMNFDRTLIEKMNFERTLIEKMNFERTLIEKMTYPEPSLPNLPIFTTQSMLTLNYKKKFNQKKLLPFLRLLDKALYIVRYLDIVIVLIM